MPATSILSLDDPGGLIAGLEQRKLGLQREIRMDHQKFQQDILSGNRSFYALAGLGSIRIPQNQVRLLTTPTKLWKGEYAAKLNEEQYEELTEYMDNFIGSEFLKDFYT